MTDILINYDGELIINELGDFELVNGIETYLQNTRERLLTPTNNLFFDRFFGSKILQYIHSDLTEELESSIIIALQQDPDIDPN
ncbi:MAG: hypothetical protein ACRCV0_00880, partial [Brevinema sp.]